MPTIEKLKKDLERAERSKQFKEKGVQYHSVIGKNDTETVEFMVADIMGEDVMAWEQYQELVRDGYEAKMIKLN